MLLGRVLLATCSSSVKHALFGLMLETHSIGTCERERAPAGHLFSKWHKEKVPKAKDEAQRPNPSKDLLALSDFLLLVMSVWFDKIVQYCDFRACIPVIPRYVSPRLCVLQCLARGQQRLPVPEGPPALSLSSLVGRVCSKPEQEEPRS